MVAIEGDKSVCSDDTIKEKIADFPPEVRDHELLSKVKGELNCISARAHTHTHTHTHTHCFRQGRGRPAGCSAGRGREGADRVRGEAGGRGEREDRPAGAVGSVCVAAETAAQGGQEEASSESKHTPTTHTHTPHHWCPNYPSLSHTQHYQTKLERVTGVKEELTLKLARLPDLSKLPTSSHGSLAPLPSVGDLFN